MIRENQDIFNRVNVCIDAMLILLSFLLGFVIRFFAFKGGIISVSYREYLLVACAYVPVQLLIYKAAGLYEPQRRIRWSTGALRMLTANAVGFAILLTVLYLAKMMDFSRVALFIVFFAENVMLIFKRAVVWKVLRDIRRKGFNQKYVIIIGSGIMARRCLNELQGSPELGYIILGYVADEDDWPEIRRLGGLEQVENILERCKADEVIAALEDEDCVWIPQIIRACESSGTRFSLIPTYAAYMPSHPQFDSLNGIPLINLRRVPLDNLGNAAIKRIFDMIVSALAIVITLPLMLAIAIGVKHSSSGPVLFKQERVGYERKSFNMYKFRSMRVNAEEKTGWSRAEDPRKTPFGSFLRKYSLDELPQLFNVLRGDMSLVGPRPELPYFVEQFKRDIPLYMVKHQVRPGITGWAQVNGYRGDTSIEKRIEYDMYYIENWSVMLDIQILFMTPKSMKNEEALVR